MPAGEEVTIGSRWRHDELVYEIRALRPIEPRCSAWGAHRLALVTPVSEDAHPLDWVPDTWLLRYWVAVPEEDLTAAA